MSREQGIRRLSSGCTDTFRIQRDSGFSKRISHTHSLHVEQQDGLQRTRPRLHAVRKLHEDPL